MTKDSQKDTLKKVKKIIKDSKIGLLTTVGKDGLDSQPMTPQEEDFNGDIWFFTFQDTSAVSHIKDDPRVSVAFSDKNENFTALKGKAKIITKQEKKQKLWNKINEKVFETTADDPELVLIRVEATEAEYWESGSKIKVGLQLIADSLGKEEHEDLGESGATDLNE